jgi:hypothetical protein
MLSVTDSDVHHQDSACVVVRGDVTWLSLGNSRTKKPSPSIAATTSALQVGAAHLVARTLARIPMALKGVAAFTVIALASLAMQAEARTPCQEYLRLRNAATEVWKQAMRAPPSERCAVLYHASLAAEATLKYADNNRESCDISVQQFNQLEREHRETVQARDNVCAGRPLRPFPADIIQR